MDKQRSTKAESVESVVRDLAQCYSLIKDPSLIIVRHERYCDCLVAAVNSGTYYYCARSTIYSYCSRYRYFTEYQ